MSFQIAKNEQTLARPSQVVSNATAEVKRTKVLIPYDGSENTETALADLDRAGLPRSLDVIAVVTDVWMPLSPYELSRAVSARRMKVLNAGASSFVPALRDYEEQQALSLEAERRIRSIFPLGTVKTEAMHDTTQIANEILRKAKQWKAELIIVGSRVSPSSHITDYAGPAAKVAREANCSVRIARLPDQKSGYPVRIIIAVDGLDSAMLVQTVGDRNWPPSSEVRLVTVLKSGPRDPGKDSETTLMLAQAAEGLRAKGLTVSIATREGKPEEVLLQEAREFAADCIFIDSDGFGQELGGATGLSKSAEAVMLGAPCSVEIVRTQQFEDPHLKPAA